MLLPHHFFMRRAMRTLARPYVVHLYTHGGPRQTRNKLKMLEDQGLWFLRPDWANVSFPGNLSAWLRSLYRSNPASIRRWGIGIA